MNIVKVTKFIYKYFWHKTILYLRLAPVGCVIGPETVDLARAVDVSGCLSGVDCVADGLTGGKGTPGGLM